MLTYRTPFVREQLQIRSRLTGLLTGGRERLYANLSGGVTEDFLNNSSELIYLRRFLLCRALMRHGQTSLIFGLGRFAQGYRPGATKLRRKTRMVPRVLHHRRQILTVELRLASPCFHSLGFLRRTGRQLLRFRSQRLPQRDASYLSD